MALKTIKFKAAFGDEIKDGGLYETVGGSWLATIDNEKIADIHFYGLPGWQVFFKSKEFDMADADELLCLMGVPLSERYPASGYVPRRAAKLIK